MLKTALKKNPIKEKMDPIIENIIEKSIENRPIDSYDFSGIYKLM